MKNRQALFGFTLIELLVTLAIAGVLVGVAVPSYFNSVKKTNRSDAKTALLNTAQSLQKCYTVYGRFNNFTNPGPTKPDCFAHSLLTTGDKKIVSDLKFYEITISNNTETTFTLTATAVKAPQTKDIARCLKLTLDQVGNKGDANAAIPPANDPSPCW